MRAGVFGGKAQNDSSNLIKRGNDRYERDDFRPGRTANTPSDWNICSHSSEFDFSLRHWQHRELLAGLGLDWGSGTGCLAIAAAKIPSVQKVVGLEIAEANVAIARENAIRNSVQDKVSFLLADSYSPLSAGDRATLDEFRGRTNFIIANPPSSDGDDGFGYRRVVLRGARDYLMRQAVVLLSISYQYGESRIKRLCLDAPGFEHHGILASTDWVSFDLDRPDLLRCLHAYAKEESRGGLPYLFQHPKAESQTSMTAQEASAHYQKTGDSPLSKWQTHLFIFK